MNSLKKTGRYVTLGLMLLVPAAAGAQTENDLQESFFPYRNGMPQHPFAKAGVVLTSENVDQARDVLDSLTYEFIKSGGVTLTIGETQDVTFDETYIAATRATLGQVKLSDKIGEFTGYAGGRPFIKDPETSDPRAGEKIALNWKYDNQWVDGATAYPMYWTFRNMATGKIERTLKTRVAFLNHKHRTVHPPVDLAGNPGDIYRTLYLSISEPFDVRNTQLLIHSFDTDLRQQGWLYLGFQRRVRRLSTGQTTDSFLGTDFMIEDFTGYNALIKDYDWNYKETRNMLVPIYRHNDVPLMERGKEADGFRFVAWEEGGCFPKATFQLRKVYVMEASPKDKNHPLSKRIYYVDAQTTMAMIEHLYDRKGDLWKYFLIGASDSDYHHPKNKGTHTAVVDIALMRDLQANHCTELVFKTLLDPNITPPSFFTVQNMRSKGR